MNRIRLLPEIVANKIAAGEVVERPASVLKELVENSIDAGASRIEAEISHGGRSLIRVSDDGCGMSRDDALLCLERHATSKIQSDSDIEHILTLGFRGEAIPSIASVSKFRIQTRETGTLCGTEVSIDGGKVREVHECGCSEGTTIEARQLFFNLPARKKFLRSEDTEALHVQHVLTLHALANPRVAFRLISDERVIFDIPSTASSSERASTQEYLSRIRALYGVDFTKQLLPVKFENHQAKGFGWIGQPGLHRSSRQDEIYFVNHRPIENPALHHAVIEGYHTMLMKGKYPAAFLFIQMDPHAVDVNVHPQKRLVRFRDEREIRELVRGAVQETLAKNISPLQRELTHQRVESRMPQQASPGIDSASRQPAVAPVSINNERNPAPSAENQPSPIHEILENATKAFPGNQMPVHQELPRFLPEKETVIAQPQRPQEIKSSELSLAGYKVLGVVNQLYVICESPEGLVLMDQHAAHERILFEKMLAQLRAQAVPTQGLLIPETIVLDHRDSAFIRTQLENLQKLGVSLSEFGTNTFLLDALPPYVKVSNPNAFIRSLIDELKAAGDNYKAQRLSEEVVAKTVCRHAVKANDPLKQQELENLLKDLLACELPFTCPHGRPTMIQISYAELEKKFGRRA